MGAHKDKVEGKALVIVNHGLALAIAYDGLEYILEYLNDFCGGGESFSFEYASIDWNSKDVSDGTYIVDLKMVSDGLGDWPGSDECCVSAYNFRAVSKEQWAHHLDGEWVWEPFPRGNI